MKNLGFNEEYQIYYRKGQEEFLYSDGSATEDYIYQSLASLEDTSIFSPSLKAKIKDWPSQYHFSSQRQNILRPFNIKPGMKVLEIGGGCGAITRYLADTGADILAVEGSLERARSIRARCKDAENLKVICSNVQDLEFDEKFDVVTLIGVFEYTEKYSNFENPYQTSLEFYRKLLKPSGKIVIAIENRLGLKYFCGYNEDHLGIPYRGLEDQYGKTGIRTFGKKELGGMLKKAGFSDVDFYYPFPDYKFPKAIITDKGLEDDNFNTADLLMQTKVDYYSGVKRINDSNDSLIWEFVDKNGIAGDLANSFIAIASSDTNDDFFKEDLLAAHYNCHRKSGFNIQTLFTENASKIQATKTYLANQEVHHKINPNIRHHLTKDVYTTGNNLGNLLYKSIMKNDQKSFEKHIIQWIDFLKKNAAEQATSDSKAKDIYFDAIPSNFILDNKNDLHYIDQEWEVKYNLSLGYIIHRYLERIKQYRNFIKSNYSNYSGMVNAVFKLASLKNISEAELKKSLEAEKEIHEYITPSKQVQKIKKRTLHGIKMDIKYKLKMFKKVFSKV